MATTYLATFADGTQVVRTAQGIHSRGSAHQYRFAFRSRWGGVSFTSSTTGISANVREVVPVTIITAKEGRAIKAAQVKAKDAAQPERIRRRLMDSLRRAGRRQQWAGEGLRRMADGQAGWGSSPAHWASYGKEQANAFRRMQATLKALAKLDAQA